MKVILAGYNVDAEVIEDLKKTSRPRQDVTPETLSASYARISRDPRSIDVLRKVAREEVEKARQSNSTIIFKMGHHSIAEHAVFNFDLIGVSRLAMEELEKFRLCAYTEKSQRYQKLEDDFLIPEELRGMRAEKDFVETITLQNKFYHKLIGKNIEPEDARYITSLSTHGQLGMTINARNLELLFRRFASHPLAEIRNIGKAMFKLVEPIAPSIILFTEANDFDKNTYGELKRLQTIDYRLQTEMDVKLVECTQDADDKLIAALLHTVGDNSYSNCLEEVRRMTDEKKRELIKTCFKYAEFYDRPLREFEYVDLTYELIVSAACFGQLKRHRMASLTCQPYQPALGVTIPDSIKIAGLADEFMQIISQTEKTYEKIAGLNKEAAPYILTNANRRRVLLKANVRELYHIARLREDRHAQWDIRDLSQKMSQLAKEVMPLSMLFIGGKDSYPEIYEECFGKRPKMVPQY